MRAFMAGLMLLAGLILLAACANLGSLFAARAADRAREDGAAPGTGVEPQAYSAATADGGDDHFPDRRRRRTMGRHRAAALP